MWRRIGLGGAAGAAALFVACGQVLTLPDEPPLASAVEAGAGAETATTPQPQVDAAADGEAGRPACVAFSVEEGILCPQAGCNTVCCRTTGAQYVCKLQECDVKFFIGCRSGKDCLAGASTNETTCCGGPDIGSSCVRSASCTPANRMCGSAAECGDREVCTKHVELGMTFGRCETCP